MTEAIATTRDELRDSRLFTVRYSAVALEHRIGVNNAATDLIIAVDELVSRSPVCLLIRRFGMSLTVPGSFDSAVPDVLDAEPDSGTQEPRQWLF